MVQNRQLIVITVLVNMDVIVIKLWIFNMMNFQKFTTFLSPGILISWINLKRGFWISKYRKSAKVNLRGRVEWLAALLAERKGTTQATVPTIQ